MRYINQNISLKSDLVTLQYAYASLNRTYDKTVCPNQCLQKLLPLHL